jgi:hypothetical protein
VAGFYANLTGGSQWVGMTPEESNEVSGHSIRVGATQDMLALNIHLASVMQAGRWKTTAMPMRYGENIQAGRGTRKRRGGRGERGSVLNSSRRHFYADTRG